MCSFYIKHNNPSLIIRWNLMLNLSVFFKIYNVKKQIRFCYIRKYKAYSTDGGTTLRSLLSFNYLDFLLCRSNLKEVFLMQVNMK